MTLIDGGLVLIVGAGGQLAAADPAFFAAGLDGVDENIVGVIVVVLTEAAAKNFNMAELITREFFKARIANGKGLSFAAYVLNTSQFFSLP